VGIAAVAYSFSTPEESRHTVIGVSTSVLGGRVPGPIFALKCPIWLSYRRPIDNNRSILLLLLQIKQFQ
jgi:hypothetical protein